MLSVGEGASGDTDFTLYRVERGGEGKGRERERKRREGKEKEGKGKRVLPPVPRILFAGWIERKNHV